MTSRDGFGLLNGAVMAMAISEKTAYFYGIRKNGGDLLVLITGITRALKL